MAADAKRRSRSQQVCMSGKQQSKTTTVIDGVPLSTVLDEEMIQRVVHGFYEEIRHDVLLGPVFNNAIAADAWPSHLAKMCDFWSATLLRTSRYAGRLLPPHLAVPGLGEMHFRRWLSLFRAVVERVCPPEVAAIFIARSLRIAHSFCLAVAFNRGEDTIQVEPILEDSL
ncbi:group III truncated hemoglobin [Mesorhizobium sp. M0323]|uniref:group III truncated hemoglobin n=1 Tax=Mesorhizobium sp. M0323 TaxID=2956938 RepID=UPI00333D2DD1